MPDKSKSNDKSIKVVMISSLLPDTHYCQYLCSHLKEHDLELIVYADKEEKNKEITNCGQVKNVWRRGFWCFREILCELRKDRPSVVHIQHELNMYGGIVTAVFFPLFLLCLKLSGVRVITTVHAVVPIKQVDASFLGLFRQRSTFFVNHFTLKGFFSYLYWLIGISSTKIIVHTRLMGDILADDYHVQEMKIVVIPHGVPLPRAGIPADGRNYSKDFLYFGYLIRRKGLDKVIGGFKRFIDSSADKQWRLILSGGDLPGQEGYRKELIDLVDKFDLQNNIVFTGFIPESQIETCFSRAYAVIVPGVVSVSASGPLSQAFGYGKCLLASNVGNFIEEVKDQAEGILVDNDHWEDGFIAAAMDGKLASKVKEGAKGKALKRNWPIVAREHFFMYKSVAKDANKN